MKLLTSVVCLLPCVIWAQDSAPINVVVTWDSAALESVRQTHPGPPIVARALAIMHTTMFEAWAAYDPIAVGTRFGGALRRPAAEMTLENKNKAVSFAAFRALADLFPTQKDRFVELMKSLQYDSLDTSTDPAIAAGIGNLAARAVLQFRHNDGSNQLGDLNPGAYSDYTGYQPVNGPDFIADATRWQPLRVSDGSGGTVTQKYIAPHWGNVIPFALSAASQFRPKETLPAVNDPLYAGQVDEVLYYSAHLTDQQKVIAEYWADGPNSELPPGHWCLFAEFVAQRDKQTVDQSVKMFFAMTNAIFDASIASWDAKRIYDSVRPVTAVHYLRKGQQVLAWAGPNKGIQMIDGADWQPYQASTVVTPPFPEYISGHSVFSSAAAEVLKQFTGSNVFGGQVVIKAGSSRVEPGLVPAADVTLSWDTFADAADEAGVSRRFGGIHFVNGDLDSRLIGKQIGKQAWLKAVSHFNGNAQ